jgi:drug/metabolite transporter (DMT)-like permease
MVYNPSKMGNSTPKTYGVLLGAITVISFAAILIKLISAPAVVIAFFRLGLATLLLAPFAWRRRAELRQFSKYDLALSLLSGLFLALHFLAWISSLKYTSVASSVVLVTTNPIFVGLGTRFILRERLGTSLLWGIAVSVAGGLLIGYNDLRFGREELLGDLLALAGAVMASAYFLVGRHVRQRVGLFNYIFVVYGLAAVLLSIFVLATRQPLFGYPPKAYLFLFLLALGPQILGHSSLNWVLKYTSAATVAVATLGEPVGSTVLAYLILGEGLTLLKVLGGMLILAGIYLAARAEG